MSLWEMAPGELLETHLILWWISKQTTHSGKAQTSCCQWSKGLCCSLETTVIPSLCISIRMGRFHSWQFYFSSCLISNERRYNIFKDTVNNVFNYETTLARFWLWICVKLTVNLTHRLANNFDSLQYQQYKPMKAVFPSALFPDLSIFMVKISSAEVKWQISHPILPRL